MGYAQMLPRYSHHFLNNMYNPGSIGIHNDYEFSLGTRTMFKGIENAPTSKYFDASSRLEIQDTIHTVGVRYIGDKYGAYKRAYFQLAYSYKLMIARKGYVSMGLSYAVADLRYERSTLFTMDTEVDAYSRNVMTRKPNVAFGAVFVGPDMRIGFAVAQLFKGAWGLADGVEFGLEGRQMQFNTSFSRNLYPYFFKDGMVQPNVMLWKIPGQPTQLDLDMVVNYKSTFFINAGMNSSNYFRFGFGFYSNNTKVFITKEYSFGKAKNLPVTNEVGVYYRINRSTEKKKKKCYDFDKDTVPVDVKEDEINDGQDE